MNKKNIYVCLYVLIYHMIIIGTQTLSAHPNEEYIPKKFSEHIAIAAEKVALQMDSLHTFLKKYYENIDITDEKNQIEEETNGTFLEHETSVEHCFNKQKYTIVATTACLIAVIAAYKYRLFFSKDAAKTAKAIQKLIEPILVNSAVLKENQLAIVFEILIKNGFNNIIIYNDHAFEVNGQFKVEINGQAVKVTSV